MKPYLASPLVRTRIQPLPSLMSHPINHQWPVVRNRESLETNPSTNVVRLENGYQLRLAVPGVPKSNIQIQVVEGQLVVSATNPNQEKEARFVRREFDYSNFKRSFTLHKNADTENLKASFENGILTIVIPNREPETRKIEIQ